MKLKEIKYGISGIYKIIFDNKKVYIGLSNDIRRRMNEHLGKDLKEHPELLISKAIQKHQIIDIEILEEIDPKNRAYMIEREKYWIKYYNSYLDKDKGYNMTSGGDGSMDGIYNNASYLSEEQLENIYNDLLHTTLTYEEIAIKNNCSYSIISRINNGEHYRNSKYNYPLREKKIDRYGVENKTSAFYNQKNKLLELIDDLKNSNLSQKDLSEKYKISIGLITNINTGKKYFQESETYPLRSLRKHCSHKRVFSDDEIIYIHESLKDKNITIQEIALNVKCDRKIISDINKGIRQPLPYYTYPIRL